MDDVEYPLPNRSFLDSKGLGQTNPTHSFPWFTDFCGIEMAHNYYIYHILSINLKSHPEIRSLIELGTYLGGLSTYCGLLGVRFGIPVHTFDNRRVFDTGTEQLFDRLGVQFHQADVFSEPTVHEMCQIVGDEPTYLICDNGDKRREFATYVPHLPAESLISVHDYGCEFFPGDAIAFDVQPVNEEEWFKYNCQFATWRKVVGQRQELP